MSTRSSSVLDPQAPPFPCSQHRRPARPCGRGSLWNDVDCGDKDGDRSASPPGGRDLPRRRFAPIVPATRKSARPMRPPRERFAMTPGPTTDNTGPLSALRRGAARFALAAFATFAAGAGPGPRRGRAGRSATQRRRGADRTLHCREPRKDRGLGARLQPARRGGAARLRLRQPRGAARRNPCRPRVARRRQTRKATLRSSNSSTIAAVTANARSTY